MDEVSPLRDAIDEEAYEWIQENKPIYLTSIQEEIANGKNPEQIRNIASKELGPDRQGLVLRCYQLARHLYKKMEQEDQVQQQVTQAVRDHLEKMEKFTR